jgi:hypothetical protein
MDQRMRSTDRTNLIDAPVQGVERKAKIGLARLEESLAIVILGS